MSVLTTAQINGFRPARAFSADRVRTYPVTNDGSTTIAIGDAVAVVAGVVTKLATTDSPSNRATGVVIGLLNSNKRPLTFNQPTLGNYLPANATGYAEVIVDDQMTYNTYYSGTSAVSLVGTNVRASDAGVTVKSGVSGMGVQALSGADATTTPFKVVGQSDQIVAGGNGTGVYVEVAFNNTQFRAGTLSQ
jgi:hypothetical protein